MSLTNWLTTQDLCYFIERFADEKTKSAFLGVFPINHLPKRITHLPILFILNTHTDNLPGQHWKAVYVAKDGNGEIFDSLASPISLKLSNWMNVFTKKWIASTLILQNPVSPSCGAYVLYYVMMRLRHSNFNDCIALFSPNLIDNDKLMKLFMTSLLK